MSDDAVLGIIETQVAVLMRLGEATRRSTGVQPHRALDRAAYVMDPNVSGDDLLIEEQLEGDIYRLLYLDGVLRQESWWYYYLLTLVYKVPEGTWLLVVAGLVVLAVEGIAMYAAMAILEKRMTGWAQRSGFAQA